MSLPSPSSLLSLDYPYQGQPFCLLASKTGMNLGSMDFSYLGVPFVVNPDEVVSSSLIKTINGLAYASIKTVNGLAIASMKTRDGLQ
jgi:hypothetical protein